MNVLLTCAGRRNYLIGYFREALGGRGLVLAADASQYAPALQEADQAFIMPPVSQPEYCGILLEVCRKHDVRLLLSLNDLELPILARERERFRAEGTEPVISSPYVIDTCFDKWATARWLASCGFRAPRTYLSLAEAMLALARGQIAFPLVVKPRWGTASIGIVYAEHTEELELAYQLARKQVMRTFLSQVSLTDTEHCVLIQEKLSGQEYGLDVVNDLAGRYVCTLVKRKLGMRAGETDRAETVAHPELEALGERIGRLLEHVGNLDCDVFATGGDCTILEMNPRFGGGYPFSHVAGANIPAALIAWAAGEEPDPSWLRARPGVAAAKYDRLIVVGPGAPECGRARRP